MRLALPFAGLLLAVLSCQNSLAQGWPVADCAAILIAGHPKPAWGSKEKITQEGLLLMINYQMTISACQQDELIKALRQPQGAKPALPAPVKPKLAEAELAKPKDTVKTGDPSEPFP